MILFCAFYISCLTVVMQLLVYSSLISVTVNGVAEIIGITLGMQCRNGSRMSLME